MKVVSCRNCGAKYQLNDNENVREYECSACAGDLEFLEGYPSISSKKSTSTPKDDLNDSELAYCTNCGLKYRLDCKEDINDYECSSCYGDLRYTNEEYNKELDYSRNQVEDNTSENELATSSDKEEVPNISAENQGVANIAASETQKESKLRESLKGEFLNNVDKKYAEEKASVATKSSYEKVEKVPKSEDIDVDSKNIKFLKKTNKTDLKKSAIKNKEKETKKPDEKETKDKNKQETKKPTEKKPKKQETKDKTKQETKKTDKQKTKDKTKQETKKPDEKETKKPDKQETKDKTKQETKKSDEKETKIDVKKSFKMKKKDEKKTAEKKSTQKIQKEETSAKDKSAENSKKSSIPDKKSKTDKRDLVVNPKIKNKRYHDFFIEIGLIIVLVGVIDLVLTQWRAFSIVFVIIGIIVFIIGLILNKQHGDSKEREKLVREKLLTLPKDFYVLSYVKLPDTDSGIDHVVIGPTGIFTIFTQKYKTKNNKRKPSLAIATYSSFKNEDLDINRKTILNFDKKEKIKFEDNNDVKQKSIQLTKNLIEYLGENGLNKFYIEPLVCFINKKVSIINIVLTDEDLFLEELLTKISNEKTKLDYTTLNKCATLLSEYSAESS
ncbi:MAG: NERD domain-containing protein [Methanobrevibacter sp.]|nr:NERD domain-containing protein [Methanobrevibacter sp.]